MSKKINHDNCAPVWLGVVGLFAIIGLTVGGIFSTVGWIVEVNAYDRRIDYEALARDRADLELADRIERLKQEVRR